MKPEGCTAASGGQAPERDRRHRARSSWPRADDSHPNSVHRRTRRPLGSIPLEGRCISQAPRVELDEHRSLVCLRERSIGRPVDEYDKARSKGHQCLSHSVSGLSWLGHLPMAVREEPQVSAGVDRGQLPRGVDKHVFHIKGNHFVAEHGSPCIVVEADGDKTSMRAWTAGLALMVWLIPGCTALSGSHFR